MHNMSRKYFNQQIFQYFIKYKNLKEQRKTQRISRNEKRCVENAKISGEIRERNTQHDKNKKKKNALLCEWQRKQMAHVRTWYTLV
jgi:hypothetical protein